MISNIRGFDNHMLKKLFLNTRFLFQTRYYWHHEKKSEDGGMVEKGHVHIKVCAVEFDIQTLALLTDSI